MYVIKLDAAKLDDGKLARIIKAANAGRRRGGSNELRYELLRCEAYYWQDVKRRQGGQPKRRMRKIKAAKGLKKLIGDGEHIDRLITDVSGPLPDVWPEPLEIGVLRGGRSAFDVLIRRLAVVFMKCFPGQRARRYSTDPITDMIKGNFIDFAEAVLTALEITHAGVANDRGRI
jgi:hypothetical protein